MKLLTTFVLTGVVDSMDPYFATVEINLNPPLETASVAVMPVSVFPCKIKEGDRFYIMKLNPHPDSLPVIVCSATLK
jgi:hypothetical protein